MFAVLKKIGSLDFSNSEGFVKDEKRKRLSAQRSGYSSCQNFSNCDVNTGEGKSFLNVATAVIHNVRSKMSCRESHIMT